MNGTNDAQPCHVEAPPQQDVYAKYQELLRIVLDQGAKGGVQLKSDQVGFEAKWRHSTLGDLTEQACLPTIQQPTVFSFLQATKSTGKNEAQGSADISFGDKNLSCTLMQTQMEWLQKSSLTYEDVALSARMLRLAIGSGIGARVTAQDIKRKYADLLQEYTASDKLVSIAQLFTILQVASFGSTHQFPFGFVIWAPKIMQPPLIYVGAQKPCLLFLLIAHETDQPFQFGTAAYDYLQNTDFLLNCGIPKFLADVVQLTHNVMTNYPMTVRIDESKQFLRLSEFAAIQSPFCAICFLSTFGARPCFLHASGNPASVTHLLGGLEGTGGLSIVGVVTGTTATPIPDWIVIHVADNGQVQELFDAGEASPCRIAVPLIWSPAWYAQQTLLRQTPRQIGKRLLYANVMDEAGEYLIFSGTEEWSRLLFSLGETPPE